MANWRTTASGCVTRRGAIGLARYRARRWYGWLRQLAPEDWAQCVAIGEIDLTEMGRQMRALAVALGFRRRYSTHRRETSSTVDIVRKPDTRPSKLKLRTGYRHSASGHSAARMKLTPERRSEIARMARAAQLARKGRVV